MKTYLHFIAKALIPFSQKKECDQTDEDYDRVQEQRYVHYRGLWAVGMELGP
jgi:hypothetical protein